MKSSTSVSSGAEIYLRRLAAGLPLAMVARRVGVSSSFLSAIEQNRQTAPDKLLAELRVAILDLSGGYWDPFTDEYLTPTR